MKIILGVTGCIGAYKAAEILRGLQQAGAQVRVVMTRHAAEFVRPLGLSRLTGDQTECAGQFGHGHQIVAATFGSSLPSLRLTAMARMRSGNDCMNSISR